MTETIKAEIYACDACEGTGVTRVEVCTDYHKGEYDVYTKRCPRCAGSGLLKRVTKTTITVSPATPHKPDREE